jgi:hypothetical protein
MCCLLFSKIWDFSLFRSLQDFVRVLYRPARVSSCAASVFSWSRLWSSRKFFPSPGLVFVQRVALPISSLLPVFGTTACAAPDPDISFGVNLCCDSIWRSRAQHPGRFPLKCTAEKSVSRTPVFSPIQIRSVVGPLPGSRFLLRLRGVRFRLAKASAPRFRSCLRS